MLAIALPIKFTLSKLFNSSAEIGTGSSKIIPSTTQTGSRFPEIEEAPRIRTFGAAPGVEVGLIIFTPANFPCNILSIEIAAPSCNSDPFTLITELAFLRLSIRWYPVITTSSIVFTSSSNTTLIVSLPTYFTSCVFIPTKENWRIKSFSSWGIANL